MIEIALEADDVVLVQSIDHPAKSFAIKLDKTAIAADCAVTETKDTSYSVANTQNKWTMATSSTSKTYWSKCEFPAGTSDLALAANAITVQLAMTNGSTKPHKLNTREQRKFQNLDK